MPNPALRRAAGEFVTAVAARFNAIVHGDDERKAYTTSEYGRTRLKLREAIDNDIRREQCEDLDPSPPFSMSAENKSLSFNLQQANEKIEELEQKLDDAEVSERYEKSVSEGRRKEIVELENKIVVLSQQANRLEAENTTLRKSYGVTLQQKDKLAQTERSFAKLRAKMRDTEAYLQAMHALMKAIEKVA